MDRKSIEITKSSFNSRQYKSLIDTEFKTFKDPEPIVDTDTTAELFRLYDKLYYNVDLEGESHQYFIKKSSELVNLEADTEAIQPFLDEIAQLRQQLLDANQIIFDLENNE